MEENEDCWLKLGRLLLDRFRLSQHATAVIPPQIRSYPCKIGARGLLAGQWGLLEKLKLPCRVAKLGVGWEICISFTNEEAEIHMHRIRK